MTVGFQVWDKMCLPSFVPLTMTVKEIMSKLPQVNIFKDGGVSLLDELFQNKILCSASASASKPVSATPSKVLMLADVPATSLSKQVEPLQIQVSTSTILCSKLLFFSNCDGLYFTILDIKCSINRQNTRNNVETTFLVLNCMSKCR